LLKQFVRVATGATAHRHERYADFAPARHPSIVSHPQPPSMPARLSSDGGVIVLREIAKRLGLTETTTGPLGDDRDPARERHSYGEMAMARMVMIAAGYEGGLYLPIP
jgi:Transposase DDE domain group 1